MRVECLTFSEIDDGLWASLVELRNRDSSYDNPMYEPEFIRILADLRPDIRVLVGFDGADPIVYFPIQKHAGHWARPAAGPFSDWHSPIGDSSKFSELLTRAQIAGVTVHGLKPDGCDPVQSGLQRECSHVTYIQESFDAYLDIQKRLYPKHFKKMRRLKRNLENNIGVADFCYDDRSDDVFEWLLNIKREQYLRTNRHDVLRAEWAQDFVARVHALKASRFSTVMSTLRVDGKLIAAELNMQSDTVLHGWLTGFDRRYAVYSPGLMLAERVIEAMAKQGIKTYDAGPGLGHYKKYYSNFSLPLDTGVVKGQAGLHPARLMGAAWRQLEGLPLGILSQVMQKIRRRMDQVLQAELTFSARLAGLLRAIRAFAE